MGNYCMTRQTNEINTLKQEAIQLNARVFDLKLKNYDLRNENNILRENNDKLMQFILQSNSIHGNIQ